MPHIFDPANRIKLEDPGRFSGIAPEKLLLAAGIKPRDIVLDIGCGTGLFALPAARLVAPRGKVYAMDVSAGMLAILRTRLAKAGVFNIEAIEVSPADLRVAPGTGNMALLADVLHEIADKSALLANLYATLQPGARLVIIEWRKAATPKGPPVHQRLAADEIKSLLKTAGFTEPAETPIEENHNMYLSKKP